MTSPAPAPAPRQFASLGAALLLLALVAVVTGIILLPFYHAVAGAAHPSVLAMERSAPLHFVRAAHHWASALLIVFGGLHLVYGLFSAAYRRPWHVAWLAAVGLFLLFLAFQLTGHLLPWDTQAVSTTAVEAGIAANAPLIGPAQGRLLRGGTDTVSQQTLTAWYVAHVVLFPLALIVLAALFLLQARRTVREWRIHKVGAACMLVALLVATVTAPVPLGPPATAQDSTSFTAPPEWYILPLHSLLVLAQRIRPSIAFLGTMVVPALAILWLLALPWLDRGTAGDRPSNLGRGTALAVLVAAAVLTLMSAGKVAPFLGAPGATPARSAGDGRRTPPKQPDAPLDPQVVQKGKTLFEQNGCYGCHKVGGKGESVGPPLDGEGKRGRDLDWQIRHLKDPGSVVPGSTMPAYGQLSDADLRALASYLQNLK